MSGALSHTPSQIIRQVIIDLGHGANGGITWPVTAGAEPDGPDNVITVYDTAGVKQGRQQIDGLVVLAYGLQLRVRSNDAQVAWKKIEDIGIGLDEDIQLTSTTVTDPEGYGTATQTYTVYNISRASGPFPLSDTSSDRKLFTLNLLAKIREA